MLEIVIWSLLVGSLGIEAVLVGGGLRLRQVILEEQKCEEEETLTGYKIEENKIVTGENPQAKSNPKSGNIETRNLSWEYKIVRANNDLFRNPAVFQQLCHEEAQVGWILLEKLDDCRVRFKRQIVLRDAINSSSLPFDPYRSHYGSSFNWVKWMGAIAFLLAITLPSYLGYVLVLNTIGKSQQPLSLPARVFESPPANFPEDKPSNLDEETQENSSYPEENSPTNDYYNTYPEEPNDNQPEEESNWEYNYR